MKNLFDSIEMVLKLAEELEWEYPATDRLSVEFHKAKASASPSIAEAGESAVALREELDLANAECDGLKRKFEVMRANNLINALFNEPQKLALEQAQVDILGQLEILRHANKVILADWAHGPFKELDTLIGGACYVLSCTAKEIEKALNSTPSPQSTDSLEACEHEAYCDKCRAKVNSLSSQLREAEVRGAEWALESSQMAWNPDQVKEKATEIVTERHGGKGV